MKHPIALSALVLVLALPSPASAENWPGFRGRRASGVSDSSPPLRWDVERGENILWKARVPGLAHSSPIVWEDRVFVTTAVSEAGDNELKIGLYGDIAPVKDDSEYEFRLLALDRATGEVLWSRTAHKGVPTIQRHTKATHANSSPATDGERVLAFFGSEGLYAYDLDGELLWKKDLGRLDAGFFRVPSAQWGTASSPILVDGKAVVQCDVQGQSFVAAFDAATGRELWRRDRDEVPTWSTPTVYEVEGRKLLALNGWKHIGGYDLETGEEVWKLAGGGDIPVPTPVVAHDLIFITNAHGGAAPIYAVPVAARGELSAEEGPAWRTARNGGYMQTPLVVGEVLYVCRDNGVLGAYEAKSGRELYRERLGAGTSGFSASGVAAGGRLYYPSETGEIYVVKAGSEFELLATNSMDEVVMATPAISDGVLFVRTQGHLVAIGETTSPSSD